MILTGSESPIVVVLSGSMEPAFYRGDLLMLTHDVQEPVRVGDIVVFKIEGREIPIVHRVLKIHEKYISKLIDYISLSWFSVSREDGKLKFLTKGDNNNVDDRGLYVPGQYWLERKDLIGKAKGYVVLSSFVYYN